MLYNIPDQDEKKNAAATLWNKESLIKIRDFEMAVKNNKLWNELCLAETKYSSVGGEFRECD